MEFWSQTLPAWGIIFASTLAILGAWELCRSFFIEFLVLNFIEVLSRLGPVVIVQYLNLGDIILLPYFSYCSKKERKKTFLRMVLGHSSFLPDSSSPWSPFVIHHHFFGFTLLLR